MAIQYKIKCARCKKNYIIVSNRTRNRYTPCYECQKKEMEGEITDPDMKKMFDIPEEFYKNTAFLRSIKINYLKFGSLSEAQVDAFKNAVEKLQAEKKAKEESGEEDKEPQIDYGIM